MHQVELRYLLDGLVINFSFQVDHIVQILDLEVEKLVEQSLLLKHVIHAENLLKHSIEELFEEVPQKLLLVELLLDLLLQHLLALQHQLILVIPVLLFLEVISQLNELLSEFLHLLLIVG